MTDLKDGMQVLKSDERGRVRMPPERREALLDEFEKSGLSGMKFARMAGVKYPTFALWAQRRRRQRAADGTLPAVQASSAPAAKMRWLEAVVEPKKLSAVSPPGVLTIHLPGGARMEVADPAQATLAAAFLRSLAC